MTKKIRFIFLISIIVLSLASITSFSHPGSLDSNGGHYNRKTGEYHYHEGINQDNNPTGNKSTDIYFNSSGSLPIQKESETASSSIHKSSTPISKQKDDNSKSNSSWYKTLIITTILFSTFMITLFYCLNGSKTDSLIKTVICCILPIIFMLLFLYCLFYEPLFIFWFLIELFIFGIIHSIIENFKFENNKYYIKIKGSIELNNKIQECISDINICKEKISEADKKLHEEFENPNLPLRELGKLIPKSKNNIFYRSPTGNKYHTGYGCSGATIKIQLPAFPHKNYCKRCYDSKLLHRVALQFYKQQYEESIFNAEAEITNLKRELDYNINFLAENLTKIYKKKSLVKELQNISVDENNITYQKNGYEYIKQYYVYLKKVNTSKAYKLKADIVHSDYRNPSYNLELEKTFIIKGNGYFLKKVYWNNGGYLTFLNAEDVLFALEPPFEAVIYPQEETILHDKHGNNYYVLLTYEKVL